MDIAPGRVLSRRYHAECLLGRGGMGEVWLCHDPVAEEHVAVKVLRSDALDAQRRRMFHHEIVATAHLDHPGIARVYDLVQEGDDLALVMEMRAGVDLGSLGPRPFAFYRNLLVQVLRALAYAHARGVLHLDVKPSNVIVDEDTGTATLVDFGVARGWRSRDEQRTEDEQVVGTLAYMAPEQVLGITRALGPWTDLYAFAVMVYGFVAGERPFPKKTPLVRTMRAAPALDAAARGLDPELGALVASLLSFVIEARPNHAADVAAAFATLDDRGEMGAGRAPRSAVRPNAEGHTRQVQRPKTPVTGVSSGASWRPAVTAVEAVEHAAPVPERELPSIGSHALFGLREVPVLGRQTIRETLWSRLVQSYQRGESCVVALAGEPGQGKSRLARDALERAHELGLAHTAWTAWWPAGADNAALGPLVRSALAGAGAIPRIFDELWATWAQRFPQPPSDDEDDDARFRNDARLLLEPGYGDTDPDLPFRVCEASVGRLARDRLAALWLDDVHSGGETPRLLVERLRRVAGPVVIIATGDAEACAALEPDLVLDVGPLDAVAMGQLVRGHLDLEGALVARIVERAAGDSLFATQVIADLVESQALERRGACYGLAAEATVPNDLAGLWERRLTRSGVERVELGLLALVRPRLEEELEEELLMVRGDGLAATIDRALRAGLLRRHEGSLAWAHEQLRDHVIDGLDEGRRVELHAIAAECLAVLEGKQDVQAERAAHLRAAGQPHRACAALRDAIAWSHRVGDGALRQRRAEELVTWATAIGAHAELARGLAELAHLHARARRGDEAREAVARAHAAEAQSGSASPWVTFRAAQVATALGRADKAQGLAERAYALAESASVPAVAYQALGLLAVAAHRRDDRDAAQRLFRQVVERAAALGDLTTQAKAMMHLGNIAPTESLELLHEAISVAQRAGALPAELSARQVYADALYEVGQRGPAQSQMEAVMAQAEARGLRQLASVVAIQRCYWALWEEDLSAAARWHRTLLEHDAEQGSQLERCMAAALAAAIATGDEDEGALVEALDALDAARGDFDIPELRKVVAWTAERAPDKLADRFEWAVRT